MKFRSILKNCFLSALVILLLASCLNPITFDPEEALRNIVISGELGIYDANNAVLWVINKTLSVNVDELTISVKGDEIDGYPHVYSEMPRNSQSLATYHRPAKDRYATQPYTYEIKMKVKDDGVDKELSIDEQLPRPSQEYAVFLVRLSNGELDLVRQADLKPDLLDSEDTSYPEKSTLGSAAAQYPIIVRNRTRSVKIDSVMFDTISQGNEIEPGNQYGYYLPPKQYPTKINYTVIGDGSKHSTVSRNVDIVMDTTETSQSWHLLYLDFFKTSSGTYDITQSWDSTPASNIDQESDYHGNFEIASVTVHNNLSQYFVYAVGARQEDNNDPTYSKYVGPEYVVEQFYFEPIGPIGSGNSKTAGFRQHPVGMDEFIIPYVSSYTISFYLNERNPGTGEHGPRVVVFSHGWNIFPGKRIEITIKDADVTTASVLKEEDIAPPLDDSNDWDITIVGDDETTDLEIGFENDPGNLEETGDNDFWLEDNDGENGRGKARITGIHRKGWIDSDGDDYIGTPNPNERFNFRFVYTINIKVEITGIITVGNKQRPLKNGSLDTDKRENSTRKRDVYVKAHTHDWGDWETTINPTATEEGEETRTCKGDPSHKEIRKLPATGNAEHVHDWGDWVVTKEPTTTEEGEETRTCNGDATHKEKRSVPVIPVTVDGNCVAGQLGIPVTSVQIKKGTTDTYNMNGSEWQSFRIEILPKNASNKTLLWSKGILVYPGSVEFEWTPDPLVTNEGMLRVKMTSQYREKKDQLPREANKLDMMVWADNCVLEVTTKSRAPQNYSREEGVLFVTGRDQQHWNDNLSQSPLNSYRNTYPNLTFPLYLNPPSLDDWNNYFKNKIDDQTNKVGHPTVGKPYSQPKVKIKINQGH